MFHRRHKNVSGPPAVPSAPGSVRMLVGHEELEAAVGRAKEFERRGIDEYQRRLVTYDRLLRDDQDDLAEVVPIESATDPGPTTGSPETAPLTQTGEDGKSGS